MSTVFERHGARIRGDRLEQPRGITVVAGVSRDEVVRVRPCEQSLSRAPGRDLLAAAVALVASIAVLVVGLPVAGLGSAGTVIFVFGLAIVLGLAAIGLWMHGSQKRQVLAVELKDGRRERIVLEFGCTEKGRDEVAEQLAERGWPLDFQ